MTVQAMRAAVAAIRAGIFDDVSEVDVSCRSQASIAVVASRMPWMGADVGGVVVRVVAGHAGAGASTVALAVAEGLAEGRRVMLVDYAEPARSGLAAASAIELGTDDDGWRRGRRGQISLFRLARSPAEEGFPPLPETIDAAHLVVDAGWSLTCRLLGSPGPLVRGARVVVVTRVTVPGVRQTEQVLAAVDGEAVVAAVGPARWPRVVQASCGPRLRALRSRGRVVRVPVDQGLQVFGLSGDRLPKPVVAAGRSLGALLVPVGLPQLEQRRRESRPRTGPMERSR
jgi:hypothetical protein